MDLERSSDHSQQDGRAKIWSQLTSKHLVLVEVFLQLQDLREDAGLHVEVEVGICQNPLQQAHHPIASLGLTVYQELPESLMAVEVVHILDQADQPSLDQRSQQGV